MSDTNIYIYIYCYLLHTFLILAATKQLYEWSFPSACPSVRHPRFFPNVSVIVSSWIFLGVITIDKCGAHAKCEDQRPKVKVTEVKTNFVPFWAFLDRNTSLNS